MTIYTVHFQHDRGPDFDTLLSVFRSSVREHMPDARFISETIRPPGYNQGQAHSFTNNTAKLEKWIQFMNVVDDDEVILADCDMVALRPAYHAFDQPFDVAVTMQSRNGKYPMNGGIVFARPTDAARDFFRLWLETNNYLLANQVEHQRWRAKYAGMNQAAFGQMYELDRIRCHLHEYRTNPWNIVDHDWPFMDDDGVFLHIKSELRRLVLSLHKPYGRYAKAMAAWYDAAGITPDVTPIRSPHRIHRKRRVKRSRGKRV